MNYTRYKYSRDLSWEILIREGIKELPIQIIPLCQQMGIHVIRYCDAPYIAAKSKDGCQCIIDGKAYILYDESLPRHRKRFTAAHELGHIIMKHLGMPDDEHEANVFASRLLMPACVLHECGVTTAAEIMELCHVSRTAAEIRLIRLAELRRRNKFYTHPLERKVYRRFRKYIKDFRQSREAAQA